jgi:hypothetical protein
MAAENNKNVQRRANAKKCGLCSETVDEDDYIDHISRCADRSSPKPKVMKNMKKCITCERTFAEDDYRDHVDRCVDRSSPKPKVTKNTGECVICFKEIPREDLERHVNECLSKSSPSVQSKPAAKQSQQSCFTWWVNC